MNRFTNFFKFIFSSRKRLLTTLAILLVVGFTGWKILANKQTAPQYQTDQVQRGTLIISVSGSGTISSGNSIPITTQASGIVNTVEVSNGQSVTSGQEIATITLDQASQQKLAAAQASYLSAKASLDKANSDLNTLQNTEFTANQKLINDAVSRGLSTTDPTYIEEQSTWLAAESAYKNQQTVITQAQTSLNASALSLSQISSTITAPSSGKISDLVLTPGLPISQNSSTNTTSTTSSQKLGTITMDGPLQATVNLSEVDVVKIQPGQKTTLTLDAFPGKSFTGTVASIDTSGSITSGVASYPTTINLNSGQGLIYPNMSVDASIITKIKTDVLLVPSSAVQTQNGQSFVRELKNSQLTQVPVQVGDSNDSETEITSGLNEGETIVTSVITNGTGGSSSPFSGGLRFGGGAGGGGGALRPGGFGGGRGG